MSCFLSVGILKGVRGEGQYLRTCTGFDGAEAHYRLKFSAGLIALCCSVGDGVLKHRTFLSQ